jgi:hypothetical protein
MSDFDVGDVRADPNRPQVFHVGYLPTADHRRTRDSYTYSEPWHVEFGGITEGGFLTHAEAIAHADKLTKEQP